MRVRCSRLVVACAVAGMAFVTLGLSVALGDELVAGPTVPPGITLVEVVRELEYSMAQVLWVRLGDAHGRTLVFSNNDQPGMANCVDECAKEFPPLLAPEDAQPFGDWSVVRRSEGRMQWAYQSHPLYTWSKEQEPGEVAVNVGLTETANLKLAQDAAEIGSLLPPAEWQVARFDPAASIPVPDGIEVQLVSSAQAVILTDFDGRTLYAFDGDAKLDNQICSDHGCEIQWLPIGAPALAMDVGDFSVVTRVDGSRQWAYKRQPLYRYSGDLLPGDVHGQAVDQNWTVAVLMENFRPAQVAITTLEGYGDVVSVDGMTLYSGSAFQKVWGGRNLRDSYKNAYHRGKRFGLVACVDDDCLQTWRPFQAPADATSNGFWEVLARHDGTNQWMYKGYALYTYAGDQAPGHNRGQATYAFAHLEGSPDDLERVMRLSELGFVIGASAGAGVYWNIAKP